MCSNIKVENQIDELNKEEFSFYFDDYTLYLDSYYFLSRETKRHSYKKIKHYERLRERESNMNVSEVILSNEIRDKAKDEVIKRLSVQFWNKKYF